MFVDFKLTGNRPSLLMNICKKEKEIKLSHYFR